MIKIEISDYEKLLTMDFSSLQMRIAFVDTIFNDDGLDKKGLEIYGKDGHSDAHSSTGFGLFCESVNEKAIVVEDGNVVYRFHPDQKIETQDGIRNASQLKETNTIIKLC